MDLGDVRRALFFFWTRAFFLTPPPGFPPRRYGYTFAAAEAGIDTKLLHGVVAYTDSSRASAPPDGPSIIHYGLHCHVGDYHFTKYDYPDFHVGECPLLFFATPGVPSRSQALCAETINTLNDALCDFYRARCPGAAALQCAAHVADASHPPCANQLPADKCAAHKAAGQCAAPKTLAACRQTCAAATLGARLVTRARNERCDSDGGLFCPAEPPS